MSNSIKRQVLASFKKLHQARKQVFKDDDFMLEAAQKRINEEYIKHRNETDPKKIQELVTMAVDVEKVLRTNVVQARLTPEGNYRIESLKNVEMHDYHPYKDVKE